jgi:hypothetical protein
VSAPRDRGALPALRGTAYVLTSLASLLFIAIVIYGYVQLNRTQTTLEDALDHLPVPSLADPASPPPAPAAGRGN